MLQLKEMLMGLWPLMKVYAGRSGRFLLKHRLPSTIIGCCLAMTMLMSVITVSIHEVTVMEDGEKTDTFHAIITTEENLLEKAGITLGEGDELNITEDGGQVTVAVKRAFPVSIAADGETVTVLLASGTVADALAKAGITCNAEDLLSHQETAALEKGMEITLTRVTSDQVIVTKSIDYETEKVKTDDLYVGETKVQQKGEKGEKKLTYSVTYLNGEESERELISEEVTKEPVNKIVLVGTKVKSNFKKTSSTPTTYKKVIAMTATAYSAGGTTASGIPAQWGVVAVDPNVIPLGTKVYVETADGKYIYGTAIAADTGGAIKGNKIDICVNTRAEAYSFGRRTVNVYIL
ncbi:MAG: G5 domain-containing protein [Clostridia bacterium]|nr:G5 domain-containing protein [Clostridia bacterium]